MEARGSRGITRVRFKMSCVECQRRRKKCNKGRPCSNCARRYPPVDCVYEAHKSHAQVENDATIAATASYDTMHGSRPLVSRSGEQTNSLPTLSSLNLPFMLRQPPPEWARKDSVICRPLAPDFKGTTLKTMEEVDDAEREEMAKSFSSFPRLQAIDYGTSKLLADLSVEPTPSNAQLFQIYFEGILPALWSADGTSPAPPIINDYWIPFMASSPIIMHSNLLRAAIWRIANQSTASEICAHHISHSNQWMGTKESLEILTLKSKSMSLLNARLRSPGGMSVDDEAIASVIFFFYNEWCWGVRESFDELNPHAQGLREMLRLRGGIKNIHSKGGFLTQFIMLMNYHLAIILERELFLCPPSEHGFPFIPAYKSPTDGLDSPLYRLSLVGMAPKWGLDDATSQILEFVTCMTAHIHSYMGGNVPDFNREPWDDRLRQIQNELQSQPPLFWGKKPSVESLIHECCRLTAIVYCRAIVSYDKFSVACTPDDLAGIYSTMSLVPITKWMQISGVWLWMLCVVNPAARYCFEGLRLRMFLKNCTSALGLIDWQVLVNCMERFLSVQLWIRERGRRPTDGKVT